MANVWEKVAPEGRKRLELGLYGSSAINMRTRL